MHFNVLRITCTTYLYDDDRLDSIIVEPKEQNVRDAVWKNILCFVTALFLAYLLQNLSDIYTYDKIHSKLEQKKPTKYIVKFQYVDTTKYTLSWNKKRLQNM